MKDSNDFNYAVLIPTIVLVAFVCAACYLIFKGDDPDVIKPAKPTLLTLTNVTTINMNGVMFVVDVSAEQRELLTNRFQTKILNINITE